LASQGFLRAHAVGEVAGDLGESDESAGLVANRRDRKIRPEARAVFSNAPPFVFDTAVSCRNFQFPSRLPALIVFGRKEAGEVLPQNLGGGITLQASSAFVPAADMTFRVQREHRVIFHRFDEEAKALLVLPQYNLASIGLAGAPLGGFPDPQLVIQQTVVDTHQKEGQAEADDDSASRDDKSPMSDLSTLNQQATLFHPNVFRNGSALGCQIDVLR
jgi:hypothetical protein